MKEQTGELLEEPTWSSSYPQYLARVQAIRDKMREQSYAQKIKQEKNEPQCIMM